MGITVKGLDEMLSKLNEAQTDEFCTQIVKDVSAKLIDGAKKLTPVRTGHLRLGFSGGKNVDGDMFMSAEAVTKMGRVFKYTLINSVEYAPYVEYGHRKPNGGAVEGRHMLSKAEQQVNAELDSFVSKKAEKYLKEIFE